MASIEFSGTELCFIAACVADRKDKLEEAEAELRIMAEVLNVPILESDIVNVTPVYQGIIVKLRDAMEREDLETGLSQVGVLLS